MNEHGEISTLIVSLVVILLLKLKPSVDRTSNNDTLLWYSGRKGKRKYIKIW